MVEALGTIARSGTKAFLEGMQQGKDREQASFIGQFGVGFYSAFMVAERVDVISRRAGSEEAFRWSSDGTGTFSISEVQASDAPVRGTRVLLHLMEDASIYTQRYTLERIVKAQSGHVPVPIYIVEKPGAEPAQVADGAALWTKPKSEISDSDYAEFYRSLAGQLTSQHLRSIFALRDDTNIRRSLSYPALVRSISLTQIARAVSSFTSNASSSPTTQKSFHVICDSFED
jgi:molecular chaperone HtpG